MLATIKLNLFIDISFSRISVKMVQLLDRSTEFPWCQKHWLLFYSLRFHIKWTKGLSLNLRLKWLTGGTFITIVVVLSVLLVLIIAVDVYIVYSMNKTVDKDDDIDYESSPASKL